MPTEILMPALSPTMEEGNLARWLKAEGDAIAAGDIIAEIETDKAVMEFEAVDEGRLGRVLIPEGTEGVKVNTPIAVLLAEGESAEDIETAPAGSAASSALSGDVGGSPAVKASPAPRPAPETAPQDRVFASPLARRIAAERGLDLGAIRGSGPHGRIVKADVAAAAAAPAPTSPERAEEAVAKPAPTDAGRVAALYADRAHEEIALDGMRKTIAARLTEAKQTIPHFYLRRTARIDALLDLRQQMNAGLAKRGIKLSVNDFIIKAVATALQAVPDANAVWAGDRILRLRPSDVAVAVAIEGGLFTPVIRDADSKSLSAISAEMKDLAGRARDRKLAPQEYQGGSTAVSNLGMYGIENFDAVINPPHGSILAVGAGAPAPVVGGDGAVTTATTMALTLSVDHRVIDGALGAQFLGAIVDGLQAPLALLA
jgi:pyruvate dehydrogenase E2 component (dihydrolipoamide acetyltransferase)